MYANRLVNLLLQAKHGNPAHVCRFVASSTKALHHMVCIQKDHMTAASTPSKNTTTTTVHEMEKEEEEDDEVGF
jgi:hypothetical protein